MNTLEHIENILSKNKLVLVSLTKPDCGICKTLKPEIEKIVTGYSNLKTLLIDLEKLPEASGRYSVSKLPTILLFAMGKEVFRKDRAHDISEINEMIEKYYKILF